MTLIELVKLAREKDVEFDRKIKYWTETRNKAPELQWLMGQLEQVLGRKTVREAAEAFIKQTEATDDIQG